MRVIAPRRDVTITVAFASVVSILRAIQDAEVAAVTRAARSVRMETGAVREPPLRYRTLSDWGSAAAYSAEDAAEQAGHELQHGVQQIHEGDDIPDQI
jgi:hypothetical protein